MGFEIAIILGVIGTSFMLAYIGNNMPQDRFMSVLKFLFYGMALWCLMFIPVFNFHLLEETNSTQTTAMLNSTFVKLENTITLQNTWLVWTLVGISTLLVAYGIWIFFKGWQEKKVREW